MIFGGLGGRVKLKFWVGEKYFGGKLRMILVKQFKIYDKNVKFLLHHKSNNLGLAMRY